MDVGTLSLGGALSPITRVRRLFTAGEKGFWYDPSDIGTLFQDSAGTTPVTAVGQPVGLMLDKSGNGIHASQVTSTARPTFQQDANGKYYLKFDGVDDFMVTPSIDFSGTDKMSVFAGVRKLSDAAASSLVGLSANPSVTPNTFTMTAPGTVAANFGIGCRGTAENYYLPSPFASPFSAVCSGLFDGAATGLTTQLKPRINGVLNQAGGAGVAQVIAGFANQPIYIGMRGGTTRPFNGHLYSLVVRGALSDANQIRASETYVNSKTGAY